MAKRYETFDHTADVGLLAHADSLGELFEALAECLADFICDRSSARPQAARTVSVEAEDVEALAVDFLCQVLNAIQVDRFMVAAVQVRRMSPTGVQAELLGETFDPARHDIHTEVKAVTYHLLKVAQEGQQWVGRVILDL